jgi:SAM-dependent methyltransferase
LGRLFAASYDRCMRDVEARVLASRRAALLVGLSGKVLEIGAGTGANLKHYPLGLCPVLTEPDRFMLQNLGAASASVSNIAQAGGHQLPFPAGRFDAVVCTLVLCSVPDVAATLSEVRRVLRPAGRFLFIEHIRDEGRRAWWQDRLRPIWSVVASGCQPNRRTPEAIESAGLQIEELERFDPTQQLTGISRWLGQLSVPFVVGRATRIRKNREGHRTQDTNSESRIRNPESGRRQETEYRSLVSGIWNLRVRRIANSVPGTFDL